MLAILGGTGIYSIDKIRVIEEISVTTPFGYPSGPIVRGRWGMHELLFLARHGSALSVAILTPMDSMPEPQRARFEILNR